jgi:hypothetical protein
MWFRQIVLVVLFPVVLTAAPRGMPAQEGGGEVSDSTTGTTAFPLIPLLEIALGDELRWRPDWPLEFPPDGFWPAANDGALGALVVTLSNGAERFSLRRDGAGRLAEFPYFFNDACLQVTAAYYPSGEIMSMRIRGGEPAGNREIEFPEGALSSGTAAPAVRVSGDDGEFFVFFLQSPVSLSETWYDAEGNLSVYYSASLFQEDGFWRISSLQSRGNGGLSAEEYFFDSGGNITEIRSPGGTYTALYRDRRPVYWERLPLSGSSGETSQTRAVYALQWNEQGVLVNLRLIDAGGPAAADSADEPVVDDAAAAVPAPDIPAEYRYEYNPDAAGNWTRRQDIPQISGFGLLIPRPGRTWTRYIGVMEE